MADMISYPIEEYRLVTDTKRDLRYVRPNETNPALYDPNVISISVNRFNDWQIVLGSYPYGLVVVDNTHRVSGDAILEFINILDGEPCRVVFVKPEDF
jgi:hypothetical protein